MDKQELINQYSKPEERLFVAKILDKLDNCKLKNKIVNTDFLDMYEKSIAEKVLKQVKINYVFYGGFDGAERTMLIIYPDKITTEIIENMYRKLMKIIRIALPSELYGKYIHKNYLGAVMKLGIKREKVGDIRVSKEGADIIVANDMADFINDKLKELTRFSKAEIQSIEIDDIRESKDQKIEVKIIIPSRRLDCIVGELIKTSRTKANEVIIAGRVFVNGENILKNSKSINAGDIITVRGKGRFEIAEIEGTTKKERIVLKVLKYI